VIANSVAKIVRRGRVRRAEVTRLIDGW